MFIESIKIENYRAFKYVEIKNIQKVSVFVGANGTGKSTLFDVFSFLKDALETNVSKAVLKRGGFKELITRGEKGSITITLKFRESGNRLATYELSMNENEWGRVVVEREVLKYRRGQHGKPWHFIDFKNGQGVAIVNEASYEDSKAEAVREEQTLDSPDILAIKGLGQFQRFRIVKEFRSLIENWQISDFQISNARQSPQLGGFSEHLNTYGDNLSLVAQYMYEHHKEEFDKVLTAMSRHVPGVSKIEAESTADGRIVLKFQDGSFKDPFISRFISDGTLKMFAYLILLHDPSPFPLLAIEEPENQLYLELLPRLVEELRSYSHKGGQVFVSTHSPDVLNAVHLEEIYSLKKEKGYTVISKLSDDEQLKCLVEEGDLVGALWRQGLLSGVNKVS